jgi:hypothetical protein
MLNFAEYLFVSALRKHPQGHICHSNFIIHARTYKRGDLEAARVKVPQQIKWFTHQQDDDTINSQTAAEC